jgi:hypothetical protein
MSSPIVYLVGAGPGDIDLMTVKSLRLVRKAQVIVYDRLANPDILKEAPANCEFIDIAGIVDPFVKHLILNLAYFCFYVLHFLSFLQHHTVVHTATALFSQPLRYLFIYGFLSTSSL